MLEQLHDSVIPKGTLHLYTCMTMAVVKAGETVKVMLSITNPRCAFCSRVIEQKLVKMSGIKDVAVSYLTDSVLVRYDPEKMTTGMIRESIRKLGYDTIVRHYKVLAASRGSTCANNLRRSRRSKAECFGR